MFVLQQLQQQTISGQVSQQKMYVNQHILGCEEPAEIRFLRMQFF